MSKIIGWGDIMGWDDDISGDIIGLPRTALRRARRANRREGRREDRFGTSDPVALRQQAVTEQNPGSPVTWGNDLVASSQRIESFGLGQVTLGSANATGILSAVTQKPMQPLALVVQATFVDTNASPVVLNYDPVSLVEILDVKMGTASQLAGVSGVPGSFFRADAIQSNQVYTPVGPGVTVSVNVSSAWAFTATQSLVIGAAMRVVSAHQ